MRYLKTIMRLRGHKLNRHLRELDIYRYLDEPGLDRILDFLERHSFLQSYQNVLKVFLKRMKQFTF